jgi:hypothetical protein
MNEPSQMVGTSQHKSTIKSSEKRRETSICTYFFIEFTPGAAFVGEGVEGPLSL